MKSNGSFVQAGAEGRGGRGRVRAGTLHACRLSSSSTVSTEPKSGAKKRSQARGPRRGSGPARLRPGLQRARSDASRAASRPLGPNTSQRALGLHPGRGRVDPRVCGGGGGRGGGETRVLAPPPARRPTATKQPAPPPLKPAGDAVARARCRQAPADWRARARWRQRASARTRLRVRGSGAGRWAAVGGRAGAVVGGEVGGAGESRPGCRAGGADGAADAALGGVASRGR